MRKAAIFIMLIVCGVVATAILMPLCAASFSYPSFTDYRGRLILTRSLLDAGDLVTTVKSGDTPNGYITSGRIHYYIKDYQGNIRQVTDANGTVEQDNHYYPYGMLMGESSDILAAAAGSGSTNSNPYLFGSKEYLTTAGANLLDFTARTYDPSIPLFHTQDPMAGNYTPFNPYLYCGSDPINIVDPNGREWKYTHNDGEDPRFEWIEPKDAYDSNGKLLPDHYVQAISFSREGSKGKFDNNSKFNIGTSTATVYKADGSTEDFDACTYPSDTDKFSTVPAGRYEAAVGKHHPNSPNGYTALRMGDVGTENFYNNVVTLDETNKAYPKNGNTATWINIHHAGVGNLTGKTQGGKYVSEGCMLIDYSKWNSFISIFNTPKQMNNVVGIIILR